MVPRGGERGEIAASVGGRLVNEAASLRASESLKRAG